MNRFSFGLLVLLLHVAFFKRVICNIQDDSIDSEAWIKVGNLDLEKSHSPREVALLTTPSGLPFAVVVASSNSKTLGDLSASIEPRHIYFANSGDLNTEDDVVCSVRHSDMDLLKIENHCNKATGDALFDGRVPFCQLVNLCGYGRASQFVMQAKSLKSERRDFDASPLYRGSSSNGRHFVYIGKQRVEFEVDVIESAVELFTTAAGRPFALGFTVDELVERPVCIWPYTIKSLMNIESACGKESDKARDHLICVLKAVCGAHSPNVHQIIDLYRGQPFPLASFSGSQDWDDSDLIDMLRVSRPPLRFDGNSYSHGWEEPRQIVPLSSIFGNYARFMFAISESKDNVLCVTTVGKRESAFADKYFNWLNQPSALSELVTYFCPDNGDVFNFIKNSAAAYELVKQEMSSLPSLVADNPYQYIEESVVGPDGTRYYFEFSNPSSPIVLLQSMSGELHISGNNYASDEELVCYAKHSTRDINNIAAVCHDRNADHFSSSACVLSFLCGAPVAESAIGHAISAWELRKKVADRLSRVRFPGTGRRLGGKVIQRPVKYGEIFVGSDMRR